MSWERSAKVGDKIVCVKDASDLEDYDPHLAAPQKDGIYTIQEIELYEGEIWFGLDGLFLSPCGCEAVFHHGGFRPVQSRPTDISVFERLLNTAPAKESEDA